MWALQGAEFDLRGLRSCWCSRQGPGWSHLCSSFPGAAGWRKWIPKGQSYHAMGVVKMSSYQGPKSIVGVDLGRVDGSESPQSLRPVLFFSCIESERFIL